MENTLTFAQGISYQIRDLDRWKAKLKPEVYAKLQDWCDRENNLVIRAVNSAEKRGMPTDTMGYMVKRGNDLLEWILNFKG